MSEPAAVDRSAMLARLAGDPQLFVDAATIFLEDCPLRLAEIRDALDRADAKAARGGAHALKGSAGVIAASDLFEAAGLVEDLADAGRLTEVEPAWRQLERQAYRAMEAVRSFR